MNEIKQNSPYAWFLAAAQDVDGSHHPVLLGSALAFSDGQFKTAPALLCALFACGMQIAANFITTSSTSRKGPTVGKTGWGRSAPAPKVGLRRQP